MLDRHLPRPDAPVGQPVEDEEHHKPDDQQTRRKHQIEAGVHVHPQVRDQLGDIIPQAKPSQQHGDKLAKSHSHFFSQSQQIESAQEINFHEEPEQVINFHDDSAEVSTLHW